MRTYARIKDGLICELLDTEGDISEMFHPHFVWVDVTIADPFPAIGWSFQDNTCSPPPAPSLDEILTANRAMRDSLIADATARIAPLQDAVDLGIETEVERSQLLSLKQYRVALGRLDIGLAEIEWPLLPA